MKQLMVKSKFSAHVITENTNLLFDSNNFNSGFWQRSAVTLTGGQMDPDSGLTATLVSADDNLAFVTQEVIGSADRKVFSIYVQRVSGLGGVEITINGVDWIAIPVTVVWTRFDIAGIVGDAIVGVRLTTSGDSVNIWHAQLEYGDTPTSYVNNDGSSFLITQVIDPDYPGTTVRGCVFMDGFFFVMTPLGEIYQSALENALDWSALDFIRSQNDPSDGVFITKVQSYIVALKEWAVEFFYNAGNPVGSVLSPVQNMTVQLGCASDMSVQEVSGSIVWMAHTKNGMGRSIVSLSGSSPQKISNPPVEKILDSSDLSDVASWSAQVGSHLLYGITLFDVGVSLVYDFSSQRWSYLTVLGNPTSVGFVSYDATTNTVTFSGDLTSGDVVEISNNIGERVFVLVMSVDGNTFKGNQELISLDKTDVSMVKYEVKPMDIVASVQSNGHQYLQRKNDGGLFELVQNEFTDAGIPVVAGFNTGRIDDGTNNNKTMAKLELTAGISDQPAYIRWSDNDYKTFSKFRPVDLSNERPQVRRLGDYRRRSFQVIHIGNCPFKVSAIDIE